ncbi:hypothetical protein Amal_04105 [Acetobacter malorum]|uniref:Uncharacterized protein n=1 Tax=Acetobacter malorum TaxID=178901 RepID=A0A177FTU9_9PROT|nr:hypothetical protein Amal_04105 [Acetobacter malorum]
MRMDVAALCCVTIQRRQADGCHSIGMERGVAEISEPIHAKPEPGVRDNHRHSRAVQFAVIALGKMMQLVGEFKHQLGIRPWGDIGQAGNQPRPTDQHESKRHAKAGDYQGCQHQAEQEQHIAHALANQHHGCHAQHQQRHAASPGAQTFGIKRAQNNGHQGREKEHEQRKPGAWLYKRAGEGAIIRRRKAQQVGARQMLLPALANQPEGQREQNGGQCSAARGRHQNPAFHGGSQQHQARQTQRLNPRTFLADI